MGKTRNETPAKEPKLMDEYDAENLLGAEVGKPFGDRMIKLDTLVDKLTEELAQAKADRLFLDKQVRAAAKLVKSIDLGPVLTMKPYDDGLRAVLAKIKKGSGVTPWEEMKGGGTDEQIKANLSKGFGPSWEPVKAAGHKLSDGRFLEGSDTYGGKVLLTGPALVNEVRRVLSIPHPPKPDKPAPAKAPAKKPAAPKPAAKKPAPKKAPAKTKAQKKTEEVDNLGKPAEAKGKGAAVAPPAPPAAGAKATAEGFGPWARAAKKALRRRKFDAAVVTEAEPWTRWHGEGVKASEAADKWIEGKDADEAVAPAGGRAKPGLLILDATPDKPLDGDTEYEPFDLGLSPGDVAKACVTLDDAAGETIAHTLIRIGGVEHVVVEYDGEMSRYWLRPIVRRTVKLDRSGVDPYRGRAINAGGTPYWVDVADGAIAVEDADPVGERAAAASDGPALGDYDPGDPFYYKLGGRRLDPVEILPRDVDDIDAQDAMRRTGLTKIRNDARRALEGEEALGVLERQLAADVAAYTDLVARGFESDQLSPMEKEDRGDDGSASAVDGALSLTHNHIVNAKTEIAALRKGLGLPPRDWTPAPNAREAAPKDAAEDTEATRPGEVYGLADLKITPEQLGKAFAGKAITRGDPAVVPAPLIIDGYPYLHVGTVDGLHLAGPNEYVVRLVRLVPELEGNAEELRKLRDEPQGAYCGRRVKDPSGDTYVVAPESYNLLVALPEPATAAGQKAGG